MSSDQSRRGYFQSSDSGGAYGYSPGSRGRSPLGDDKPYYSDRSSRWENYSGDQSRRTSSPSPKRRKWDDDRDKYVSDYHRYEPQDEYRRSPPQDQGRWPELQQQQPPQQPSTPSQLSPTAYGGSGSASGGSNQQQPQAVSSQQVASLLGISGSPLTWTQPLSVEALTLLAQQGPRAAMAAATPVAPIAPSVLQQLQQQQPGLGSASAAAAASAAQLAASWLAAHQQPTLANNQHKPSVPYYGSMNSGGSWPQTSSWSAVGGAATAPVATPNSSNPWSQYQQQQQQPAASSASSPWSSQQPQSNSHQQQQHPYHSQQQSSSSSWTSNNTNSGSSSTSTQMGCYSGSSNQQSSPAPGGTQQQYQSSASTTQPSYYAVMNQQGSTSTTTAAPSATGGQPYHNHPQYGTYAASSTGSVTPVAGGASTYGGSISVPPPALASPTGTHSRHQHQPHHPQDSLVGVPPQPSSSMSDYDASDSERDRRGGDRDYGRYSRSPGRRSASPNSRSRSRSRSRSPSHGGGASGYHRGSGGGDSRYGGGGWSGSKHYGAGGGGGGSDRYRNTKHDHYNKWDKKSRGRRDNRNNDGYVSSSSSYYPRSDRGDRDRDYDRDRDRTDRGDRDRDRERERDRDRDRDYDYSNTYDRDRDRDRDRERDRDQLRDRVDDPARTDAATSTGAPVTLSTEAAVAAASSTATAMETDDQPSPHQQPDQPQQQQHHHDQAEQPTHQEGHKDHQNHQDHPSESSSMKQEQHQHNDDRGYSSSSYDSSYHYKDRDDYDRGSYRDKYSSSSSSHRYGGGGKDWYSGGGGGGGSSRGKNRWRDNDRSGGGYRDKDGRRSYYDRYDDRGSSGRSDRDYEKERGGRDSRDRDRWYHNDRWSSHDQRDQHYQHYRHDDQPHSSEHGGNYGLGNTSSSAAVPAPTSDKASAAAQPTPVVEDKRLEKEKIVQQLNTNDDGISQLEKELEALKKEKERVRAELFPSEASAAAAASAKELAEATASASDTAASATDIASMELAPGGDANDLVSRILAQNRFVAQQRRDMLVNHLLRSIAMPDFLPADIASDPQEPTTVDQPDFAAVPPPIKSSGRSKNNYAAAAAVAAKRGPKLFSKPTDLPFFAENKQQFDRLRAAMVRILIDRGQERLAKEKELKQEYRKLWIRWKRRLRRQKQDEASERVIQTMFQSTGGGSRRFPMRGVRVQQQEKVLAQKERAEKEKYDEDDDDRFERTRATIPAMAIFEPTYEVDKYTFVDNNTFVPDAMAVEREYKVSHSWHPEEEDIFLKAYLRYPKDFEKITSFLPYKTLKDVIWFYYTAKFRLDLKKRVQRDQEKNHIDLGLTPDDDPHNLTSYLTLGTTVEWVNGTGRRGSMRLSEKSHVNYNERNLEKVITSPRSSTMSPKPGNLSAIDAEERQALSYLSGSGELTQQHRPSTPGLSSSLGSNRGGPDRGDRGDGSGGGKGDGGGSLNSSSDTINRWTPFERDQFMYAYSKHQKDWKAIADFMKTKNISQVKNFYHNNKRKLHLDDPAKVAAAAQIVAAIVESDGSDGRPKPAPGPRSPRSPSTRDKAAPPAKASERERIFTTTDDDDADSLSQELDVETDSPQADHGPSAPASASSTSTGVGNHPYASANAAPRRGRPRSTTAATPPVGRRDAAASHWTETEKQALIDGLKKYGKKWAVISELIGTKAVPQIKNFFSNYRFKLNLDDLIPEHLRGSPRGRGKARGGALRGGRGGTGIVVTTASASSSSKLGRSSRDEAAGDDDAMDVVGDEDVVDDIVDNDDSNRRSLPPSGYSEDVPVAPRRSDSTSPPPMPPRPLAGGGATIIVRGRSEWRESADVNIDDSVEILPPSVLAGVSNASASPMPPPEATEKAATKSSKKGARAKSKRAAAAVAATTQASTVNSMDVDVPFDEDVDIEDGGGPAEEDDEDYSDHHDDDDEEAASAAFIDRKDSVAHRAKRRKGVVIHAPAPIVALPKDGAPVVTLSSSGGASGPGAPSGGSGASGSSGGGAAGGASDEINEAMDVDIDEDSQHAAAESAGSAAASAQSGESVAATGTGTMNE